MADEIVIFVTCPAAEAETIASSLVEERLAACVNIVASVTSVYRWEGKVTKDFESMLIVKSSSRLFEELKERLRQLHSYDVPEIIAIAIKQGSEPYLDWVNCQLKDGSTFQPAPEKALTGMNTNVNTNMKKEG